MSKILAGVFVGVFLGVLAVKLLEKAKPSWLQGAHGVLRKGAKAAKDAFAEGYAAQTT